jgi:dienelactone hydrolase
MPIQTLFSGTSHPVDMEVFAPSGVLSTPQSVVVAYGTDGLIGSSQKLLEDFCRDDLAKAGYTAVLPRYLEITRTAPLAGVLSGLTATNLKEWTRALVEAVSWCKTNQGNDNVALIGFSLGGYMAARTALATPVKAVVDFFGPMNRFGAMTFPAGEEFDDKKAKGLPPTQIHHGTLDSVVAPTESADLERWLVTAGIRCEFHHTYVCGHPQDREAPPWTPAEQNVATGRALKFLSNVMP